MIILNGREVTFETFPNGETKMITDNMIVNNVGTAAANDVSFKYESDSDLIKLMFVKKYIDSKLFYQNPSKLLIYYMPYSRMDRTEQGSAFTLKYVSEFINGLGFTEVSIIEPHSDVTPALVNKSDSIEMTSILLDSVLNDVDFDIEKDFLVYPDAGAQKRYSKMYGGKSLVGYKERDWETGRIKSLELIGEGEGAHKAIIVDDLTSYGGTFLWTASLLKERGFKEIYLLVAHAEKSLLEGKVLQDDSPIDKVFTTDTIISPSDVVWDKAQYKNRLHISSIKEMLS